MDKFTGINWIWTADLDSDSHLRVQSIDSLWQRSDSIATHLRFMRCIRQNCLLNLQQIVTKFAQLSCQLVNLFILLVEECLRQQWHRLDQAGIIPQHLYLRLCKEVEKSLIARQT